MLVVGNCHAAEEPGFDHVDRTSGFGAGTRCGLRVSRAASHSHGLSIAVRFASFAAVFGAAAARACPRFPPRPQDVRGGRHSSRQTASSHVKRPQIAEGVSGPGRAPIDSVVMCSGGGALAQCKSPIVVPSPGQHGRTRAQTGWARNDAPAGLSAQATTHEK